MATQHPPYKKIRDRAHSDELPHGDFVWDVRAERASDEPSGAPSEPMGNTPSMAAGETRNLPVSEVLRRFPRPGAEANRFPRTRKRSPLVFAVAVFAAVGSAAAAAWVVAGL